jgi:hypothetical protein
MLIPAPPLPMVEAMRCFPRAVMLLFSLFASVLPARAVDDPGPISPAAPLESARSPADRPGLKERLLAFLPAPVSQGLDVDVWLWLSYVHNDQRSHSEYEDAQLSLSITKTFGKNVATTFEGNLLDASGYGRLELEQAFITVLASEKTRTLVTVGKFNAGFGVEARDFWNRTTGTTSPLFGAQPQDLVGVMVTQPLGGTGVTLRPFVSADFQGEFNFDQSPSAGMTVEYRPNRDFDFAITQWVGPGVVLYGGEELRMPYKGGVYGEDSPTGVIGNWQGPHLVAERGGTLYFLDAKAIWHPYNDLTLSAEYLMGTSRTHLGRWGWAGMMGLANYDLTDHWSLFGRVSYLDDNNWLITGAFHRLYEFSGGIGYRFNDRLEVRGEYRHDYSNKLGDADTVSIHLTAGF